MRDYLRRQAFNRPIPISWVYFIYAAEINRVKIGTSNDPEMRLYALSKQAPCEYTIIGLTQGDYDVEQAIHERFAQYRVYGEWFTYSPEIADYVARYTVKHTDDLEAIRGMQ